ncbi:MAG: hypothetical protein E2590_04970 [Chryseobacterium sp.]|nr:hypothetical protein [Chryseobacterium sp.]
MKKILFFTTISVLILSLTSCHKEVTETATPERSLIILMKDKSASVSGTDTEKETKHLKSYLAQYMAENTDVVVMDINSNSNSRTNAKWFYYKAPKRQVSTRNKSKKQEELDEMMYQEKIYKTLQTTQKKVVKAMNAKTASSQETAIVEVVIPISDMLKDYDKASVLIYSDLIQESGFRNFTKGQWAMPSKSYATDVATKDFERLQQQGSEIDLSKISFVDVVTPNNPKNEKFYVNMPSYFDEIFRLGKYSGTIDWKKL